MPAGPGIGNDNVVGSAWVQLGVNPKKFNQGLNMAMGSLAKFAAIAAPLAVGVGIALGFKKAVSAAGNFEQAMAMVKAVTLSSIKDVELQGEMFDSLSKKAKTLGKTTKWQMTEIAEGMENLGRAGFSANEIISSIAGVSALAASQMMELSEAADITAMILRSMNMIASESADVADVLAYAASNSAARVQGLGETFKYVGPLASAFGSSVEETTAMIMLLADAGIRGSQAGTGLRMAFAELLGMTTSFRAKLKSVGIAASDLIGSNGKMMKMAEIFGVFQEKGLGAAAMIELFGKRAGPAMSLLLRSGQQALEEYTQALEESGGAAAEMAEIMRDSLQGQITILSGSWNLLLTTIGEKGTKIFQTFLEDSLIPVVNEMVLWAETSPAVERAMEGIATALTGIAKNATKSLNKVLSVLDAIVIAITALIAFKLIVWLAALVKGIWAAATAATALHAIVSPLTALFGLFVAGIGTAVFGFRKMARDAQIAADSIEQLHNAENLLKERWTTDFDATNASIDRFLLEWRARADLTISGLENMSSLMIQTPDIAARLTDIFNRQVDILTAEAPDLTPGQFSAVVSDLNRIWGMGMIATAETAVDVVLTETSRVMNAYSKTELAPALRRIFELWLDTSRIPQREEIAGADMAVLTEGPSILARTITDLLATLEGVDTFSPDIFTQFDLAMMHITDKINQNALQTGGDEWLELEELRTLENAMYDFMVKRVSEEEKALKVATAWGTTSKYTQEQLDVLKSKLGIVSDESEKVSDNFRKLSDKMSTFASAFGKASNLLLGDELGGNLSAVFGIIQKQAKASEMKKSAASMPTDTPQEQAAQMAAMDAAEGGQAAAVAAAIELIIQLIEQGVQFVNDQLTEAGSTAMAFAESLWGAITATEAWSDMMDGLQSAMSRLMNAILSPLMLLGELFRILGGKVIEVTDAISDQTKATEEAMSDLNTPKSWREDRVRWAAIRPGETPRDYSTDDTGTTTDDIDQELSWLEQAIEQFRGLFQHHLDWFGGFVDRMREIGVQLFPAFLEILEGPLTTFENVMDDIASWIEDVFAADFEAFASGFHNWWTTDVDPFLQEDVFKFFGDAFKDVYEWIGSTFLPFLKNELWPAFKTDVWPAVKDALTNLGGALSDLFTTIDDNMPTLTQFLTDFLTGIISKWTGMVETVNAYTLTKAGDLAGGLKVIWESESLSLWEKTKTTIGLGAIAFWEAFMKFLEPLKEPFEALGKALGELWEQISPILIPAIEALAGIIQITLMAALWILVAAVKVVSFIFDLIAFVLKSFVNVLIGAANALIWMVNLVLPKSKDIAYIPMLDGGGDILGTGIAVVHAGESVLDTAMAQSAMAGAGAGGGEVHVYLGSEEVTDMVVTEVRRESGRKYGKTHTSRMFRER